MKDALGHGSNPHGGAEQSPGAHTTGIRSIPTMNRAHFELIAENLKSGYAGDPTAHAARVNAAADQLATTNPNFNRARFIAAATPGATPMKGARSRASSRANASRKAQRWLGAESLSTANRNLQGK